MILRLLDVFIIVNFIRTAIILKTMTNSLLSTHCTFLKMKLFIINITDRVRVLVENWTRKYFDTNIDNGEKLNMKEIIFKIFL